MRNIFLMLFVFLTSNIYSQVIVSVYENKTIPINFKICGKSKIVIENPGEIINKVKSDASFISFFNKYKDSVQYEPHSSLMLFKVNRKSINVSNHVPIHFELDNLVGNFMTAYFKKIKFKNLRKENTLGFYIYYIPEEHKFKIGFVEFKNKKYYSIYVATGDVSN